VLRAVDEEQTSVAAVGNQQVARERLRRMKTRRRRRRVSRLWSAVPPHEREYGEPGDREDDSR